MDLSKLRKEIDRIDDQIINLLEKRFYLALQTTKFKSKIRDKQREDEILKKIGSTHIKEIYKAIFKNNRKKQKEISLRRTI